MQDTLVPIFACFFLFGLPIIAWIVKMMLAHRERMEMIRSGYNPFVTPAAGVPPQPGPRPVPQWVPPPQRMQSWSCDPQMQLRRGLMTASIGLALFIGLTFVGYDPSMSSPFHYRPGPWLLGGLIPLFVGIAQIIGALASGAEWPSALSPRRTRYSTPPPAGWDAAAQARSAGPKVEELRPPSPPPAQQR